MKDSDLIWQTGTVRNRNGRTWLDFGDPAACSRCSRGTGCGAALFSRLFSRPGGWVLLRGDDVPGEGQRVRAGLSPQWLMMAAAMLYLLPVAAFLAGALAADLLWPGKDLAALAGGMLAAFLAVGSTRNRLRSRGAPGLKLVEIDAALESRGVRDHFLSRDA